MHRRLITPPHSADSLLPKPTTAPLTPGPASASPSPPYHHPSARPGLFAGHPSPPTSPRSSTARTAAPVVTVAGHADPNYPASMTSSVQAHVYEGGLRYHAYRDGKYAFPNDEMEQNRDDMKHAMTLLLMGGKHFYAPVEEALEEGGEVLDLGTGTGIWAIELGEKFPNATVRGIDLSPIQPTFVPRNVFFAVDDIEDEWVYTEGSLDYIHMRHTVFSIQDRQTLLQRAYKYLKPGGYIEFQELHFAPTADDATLTPTTPYALSAFITYLSAGLRALTGADTNAIATLPAALRAAGFAGVTARQHKCPLGVWPRDSRQRYIGLFLRTAIMDGLRGLSRRPLVGGLGWTELQVEMFLVEVRKAVMNDAVHAYLPFHVVYARKPLG